MASEKQIEGAKRAREARRAKQLLQNGAEVPMKESTCKTNVELINEHKQVWLQALLASLQSCEVRHETGVVTCVPIANKVLELYKEKFN